MTDTLTMANAMMVLNGTLQDVVSELRRKYDLDIYVLGIVAKNSLGAKGMVSTIRVTIGLRLAREKYNWATVTFSDSAINEYFHILSGEVARLKMLPDFEEFIEREVRLHKGDDND